MTTRPTTSHVLWDGAVAVDCFGRSSGNWALKGYERSESEAHNPGIGRKIEALLRTHRIGRLYMPSPHQFNAKLACPTELRVPWKDGQIFRGVDAEGVLLDKIEDACGIASSDCPTIVARNALTGLVVSAHAGRESLYDADHLFRGFAPRRHTSVVDAIVERLSGGDARMADSIQAYVTCGICQANFSHPYDGSALGERNKKMCEHLKGAWGQDVAVHGHISLFELITRQFEARGVHPSHVRWDRTDTFSDKEGGVHQWHSHRRDQNGERNFVLVTRRF